MPAKPRHIDGDAPAAVTPSSPAALNTIAAARTGIGSAAGAATRLFGKPVTERPESAEESVILGLDTEYSISQITLWLMD